MRRPGVGAHVPTAGLNRGVQADQIGREPNQCLFRLGDADDTRATALNELAAGKFWLGDRRLQWSSRLYHTDAIRWQRVI